MRKLLLAFILILSSTSIYSQKYSKPQNLPEFDQKRWHFGFTLGPEFQDFRISNKGSFYSEVPSSNMGFHVGIITSRKMGRYFNLRMIPSLSLGQKTVNTKLSATDVESTVIKSTYICLPILVKYKALRIDNARPYLISGVNFKYDTATDFEAPITLKKFDTCLEFGLGSDFYLQTFRFGIEVRFSIGLNNMLDTNRPDDDPPAYSSITSSINSIRAKTFTIAFNFE